MPVSYTHLTKEEKQEYINQFLRKYKLKVSNKCNLIYELSKKEMLQIEKELMYIVVKSRANNIHTITDKFLPVSYTHLSI